MPLSLFLFISLVGITTAGPHYPVVLVPGDGGSQLVVKLNKTTSKHWFCEKHTSDYESLWVNLEEFAPPLIYCFVENMMLIYDNKTRTTREPQGVDIKTVGFGDTASVEWLDPSWASHQFSSVSYFYPIVNDLVAVGYKRNVSVRGAPFDFRKAPNELASYYNELKLLIEQTYDINNSTRCVLVAHSYGNPVLLYFLNHQPQSWKDKYIQAFVALAGVWGGAIKPLRLYASGDSLGVVIVGSNTVRPEQRSMPSTAFLMPSNKLWGPEEVMVVTEHRNYTVADFKDYFHDLNFPDGWQMHLDTQGLLNNLTAPNVSLHCVHGVGLPTPGTLVFGKGEFPDTFPKNIPDDGDGTVNIRSLLVCLDWRSKQHYPVNHTALKGAEHMEILADPRARKYVVNVALGQL
ncbi:group XV phospholipase a2 [Plakobranchus ocellatus]|uniref:Group XV phospholipase a2 n=1 Tax=Plakobranchus ocellatus TaxID=259542 RepID=A0AAV4BP70_9GAST|nr:group XV phospholipase a2 [Plakobranchus ocellatus]